MSSIQDIHANVYDFLAEECRCTPELWNEFGTGILSHVIDVDFFFFFSEHLDCFRVCDDCGKPMLEGYLVDGSDAYCSKEYLNKHISDLGFNALYNEGCGDAYWSTWYEESKMYMKGQML